MPWTIPKTWSAGETLTAANFNTYIRDNQLAMAPHLLVRKTSDEAISVTTLQADDNLLFNVPANEIWYFWWSLLVTGSATTADLAVRFTFPASGDIAFSGGGVSIGGAYSQKLYLGTTSPTTSQDYDIGTTGRTHLLIEGVYTNAGTGGNVALEWAPSGAGTTTMKANSTLWGVKLA